MTTRPRLKYRTLFVSAAALAVGILGLGGMSCISQTPPLDIGLADGILRPCPDTPNCVASENINAARRIAPFLFEDTAESAWQLLADLIREEGGRIEKQTDHYLWATFRSLLFRFVDDVEFRLDAEAKRIHVRSGARAGFSDFGVNRRRVESLRERWQSRDVAE